MRRKTVSFNRRSSGEFMQPLEPRDLRAADLVITGISVAPHVTSAGQSFQITYTVKNLGTAATTKTCFIHNSLSRDAKFGNADDIQLDTEYYKPSIGAGKSVKFTVLSGTGISQPAGSFRVGGKVDSVGLISESNEKNNTKLSAANELVIAQYLNQDTLPASSGSDKISLSIVSNRAIMIVNGKAYSRPVGFFGRRLYIDAGGGNDKIVAEPNFNIPLAITGGTGNDTIIGGSGADTFSGAAGNDSIVGGAGYDSIAGGIGDDSLYGGIGRDTVLGGDGDDWLDAGTGTDQLRGGEGNDHLSALDGTADYRDSLFGDNGIDTGVADDEDILTDIEL